MDPLGRACGLPSSTLQGGSVGESRELVLDGDEVYIDALVIKFEDTFVTAGDALKGKALLLFRRIFTDRGRPADGVVLDREGQIPQSYAAERAPDGVRTRALGSILGARQQSRGGAEARSPRPARRGRLDPSQERPRLHHRASIDRRADDPADAVGPWRVDEEMTSRGEHEHIHCVPVRTCVATPAGPSWVYFTATPSAIDSQVSSTTCPCAPSEIFW